MKTIIKNAFDSYLSSIIGGIVGIPEIITGITTHDTNSLIKGIGLFLLGLVAKEK